jgi:hypothetical protein
MEIITRKDLVLMQDLYSRKYTGNSIYSNTSQEERNQFNAVKLKLKNLAVFFAEKYNPAYGPFYAEINKGNLISMNGTNLKRIWSGICRGNDNKQYSAQISFVMNPQEACLDVGFYFGRSIDKEQRNLLEEQLRNLAINLSTSLKKNRELGDKYSSLFDLGFTPIIDNQQVLPSDWYNLI